MNCKIIDCPSGLCSWPYLITIYTSERKLKDLKCPVSSWGGGFKPTFCPGSAWLLTLTLSAHSLYQYLYSSIIVVHTPGQSGRQLLSSHPCLTFPVYTRRITQTQWFASVNLLFIYLSWDKISCVPGWPETTDLINDGTTDVYHHVS